MARAIDIWRRYGASGRLAALGVDPTEDVSSMSSSIDVDTLLDTAAAVAREIEVDGVVTAVLELALQNAGAQRAMLVLQQAGQMTVTASAELSVAGAVQVTTEPTTLAAVEHDSPVHVQQWRVPGPTWSFPMRRPTAVRAGPRRAFTSHPLDTLRTLARIRLARRSPVSGELARTRRLLAPTGDRGAGNRRSGGDRDPERRVVRHQREMTNVLEFRTATVPPARPRQRGQRPARRCRGGRRHGVVQRPPRFHHHRRTLVGVGELRTAQLLPRADEGADSARAGSSTNSSVTL